MRPAATMPDHPHQTPSPRTALALGHLAHALFRLLTAAALLAIPAGLAFLLWSWLSG